MVTVVRYQKLGEIIKLVIINVEFLTTFRNYFDVSSASEM